MSAEKRIQDLLSCCRCSSLSIDVQMFQCANGHLLCFCCLTYLVREAESQDAMAKCPSCACNISLQSCSRNWAIEKTVRELSCSCKFCGLTYTFEEVLAHEQSQCSCRPVDCELNLLGCSWRGTAAQRDAHVAQCTFARTCGANLNELVKLRFSAALAENRRLSTIVSCFSSEEFIVVDLVLFEDSCVSEGGIKWLCFDTKEFVAFSFKWCLRAKFSSDHGNQQVPSDCASYKLVLRSQIGSNNQEDATLPQAMQTTLDIRLVAMDSPANELLLEPVMYRFAFTNDIRESSDFSLPISCAQLRHKFVSLKSRVDQLIRIPIRVALFLHAAHSQNGP